MPAEGTIVRRLEEAVESGTLQELQTVLAEVESWEDVFSPNETSMAYLALWRGDHDVVKCLLRGLPAWTWTKRGIEEHGGSDAEGGLTYATIDTVSDETFELIIEVLGKEWLALQPMRWRQTTEERVERILQIWGELARGAEYSAEIRSNAMAQCFSFVEFHATSPRGEWELNYLMFMELMEADGDAVYRENFAKEGGWDKIVSYVALPPSAAPLEDCLSTLRDEDIAEVGTEGLSFCFTHRRHIMENHLHRFSRDAWAGRTKEDECLLLHLAPRFHADAIRRMVEVLGREAVKSMSEEVVKDSQENVLFVAARYAPSEQFLDEAMETIHTLLELNPDLARKTLPCGDTVLHRAARHISPNPSSFGDGTRERREAEAFCLAVAQCLPRGVISLRNNDGQSALDIVTSVSHTVAPELVNALTTPVKSAYTS